RDIRLSVSAPTGRWPIARGGARALTSATPGTRPQVFEPQRGYRRSIGRPFGAHFIYRRWSRGCAAARRLASAPPLAINLRPVGAKCRILPVRLYSLFAVPLAPRRTLRHN